MNTFFMFFGAALIGIVLSLLGYSIIGENGLIVKNIVIQICCSSLWACLCIIIDKE